MHNFDLNFSPIDESHQLLLSRGMVKSLRERAREILTNYFRLISIKWDDVDGVQVPRLSFFARKAIRDIFNEGIIEEETALRIQKVAIEFSSQLMHHEKECLCFYFVTSEECLKEIDELILDESYNDSEEDEEEDPSPKIGKYIARRIQRMMTDSQDLSYFMVMELIHLQDIFSTEDLDLWDVTSITGANERFEQYAGKGQILIPHSIDEYEYWKKIIISAESLRADDEME